MGRSICVVVVAHLVGCKEPAPKGVTAKPAAVAATAPARVRVVHASATEPIAAAVLREREVAAKAGDRLLVCVGATWCEPCRRFHDAFESGRLDTDLPNLRLLELDLDKDGARLQTAGYVSEMVPLFALPGPDGRASGRMSQGAIKGDGAVPYIVPKLVDLLK